VRDGLPPARTEVWAHNLYLEFLAERGVVGFSTLILILVLAFRSAGACRRHRDPEIRGLGAVVAASLVAFCFAGILELSFLRLWVVVVLFMLLGIAAQLSARTT
jgi:O-antigen ligase